MSPPVLVVEAARGRRNPIRVTDDQVVVPRRIGPARRVDRARLTRVVYVRRLIVMNPAKPRTAVIALDAAHRRRLDLRSGTWPSEGLWLLALALDVPINDYTLATSDEVHQDVPGAIRWRAAYPGPAIFLMLVAMLVLAALVRLAEIAR